MGKKRKRKPKPDLRRFRYKPLKNKVERVFQKAQVPVRVEGRLIKPCNKRLHASKASAETHIAAIIRDGDEAPNQMTAYYCERCRAWHIGHGWQENFWRRDEATNDI